MQLDHVVIHIASLSERQKLQSELSDKGIPYEPNRGKRARGFSVSNIWFGREYFEIVHIHDPVNAWQPSWAERYATGERGTFCLFLRTDEDIDVWYEKLAQANLDVSKPERTQFRWLFGLLKVKMPWRFVLLPKIPGSPIELGIIQYDEGTEKRFAKHRYPNTQNMGLTGLKQAFIQTSDFQTAQEWLSDLSLVTGPLPVQATNSHAAPDGVSLNLTATTARNLPFREIAVLDTVITVDQ